MKAIKDEVKNKRLEVYGESEEVKKLADELVERIKLKASKKEYFLKVPFNSRYLLEEMGTSFQLYLYMIQHITRPSEINDWWAKNVRPYFKEGYLPFAQHLDYIAKHAYSTPISVPAVSKQIQILKDLELIHWLNRVKFTKNRYINIWSVGRNVPKQTIADTIDYEYLFYFTIVYKKYIPIIKSGT